MRRLVALSVILALLFALFRAPFFHLHEGKDHGPHEPGHRNLALIFHTHFKPSSTSSGHPLVDVAHIARSVQAVDILLLEQQSPSSLPIQGEQPAFFFPLVPLGLTIYELIPRIHDPPWVHSSIPRSPPA
jgi:hypothetical protein